MCTNCTMQKTFKLLFMKVFFRNKPDLNQTNSILWTLRQPFSSIRKFGSFQTKESVRNIMKTCQCCFHKWNSFNMHAYEFNCMIFSPYCFFKLKSYERDIFDVCAVLCDGALDIVWCFSMKLSLKIKCEPSWHSRGLTESAKSLKFCFSTRSGFKFKTHNRACITW